ncbi:MAG: cbb3-type cytochrome oxidase assembly protein CcoS [Marinoscillum sp.]
MSVVIILIGFSLVVATGFLIAFIWASRSGQYDDDYTPSVRILFDEELNQSNHVNSDFIQRERRADVSK